MPVMRFSVLLAALLLSLCAGARAQGPPPFCYNVTTGTTTYKSDVDTASLWFNAGTYGQCGSCYVSMYASDAVIRSQPGKPNDTVTVSLSLSCSEYCNYPNYNYYYGTYRTTDTSGVNIDAKKNKASASIVSTLNLDYSYGSSGSPSLPQTASINVQGTPNGQSSSNNKCSGDYTYTTPCSVVTTTSSKSASAFFTASFTGTVTLGGTTYDVANAQYSSGYITEYDSATKTVTKTQ